MPVLLAGAEGLDDCFGSASHSFGSRPLLRNSTRSPLFAENSTPDCFLNAQTLTGSSPYSKKRTDTAVAMPVLLAGAEGLEPSARGFGVFLLKNYSVLLLIIWCYNCLLFTMYFSEIALKHRPGRYCLKKC